MSLTVIIALQLAQPVAASSDFDLARVARPGSLSSEPGCTGEDDEVVVCARKQDSYRLPLPAERAASDLAPTRGDAGRAIAAMTPTGRCGIFAGERRCSKAEAAHYGYGGGRDPITVLTKLATKAIDPDAD